jgi:hypothetical protein
MMAIEYSNFKPGVALFKEWYHGSHCEPSFESRAIFEAAQSSDHVFPELWWKDQIPVEATK